MPREGGLGVRSGDIGALGRVGQGGNNAAAAQGPRGGRPWGRCRGGGGPCRGQGGPRQGGEDAAAQVAQIARQLQGQGNLEAVGSLRQQGEQFLTGGIG
ncbi:MAG: hypothetical protein HY319_03070 [Armatimonadetes bacterium]|nr:hypothetical protein [Armatimonadota bacterium]